MALISVITPNATQPKKDTWDKIAQSIEVINGVLGTGINAAKVYNDFENTGINREMVGLKKDELNIERQKTAVGLLDKLEQAKPDDPNAFEFDINSITNPGTARDPAAPKSFFRVKPQEIDPNDFFDNISKGHMKIITNPADAADLKIKGFPVSDVRVKGLPSGIQVALDPEQIKKNLGLANKKAETDIAKTEAETKKLQADAGSDKLKGADELRKEFEGKVEIKTARDVISIADKADELVKLNTVPAQAALLYGWVRAQSPGIVSPTEIELASRGAFTDEMLQKFGWQRLSDGRFLNDQQLKDVADSLKLSARSLLKTVGPQVDNYARMAKERGFNVDDVIVPLRMHQDKLFKELDPSYLLTKDPKEMTPFEKELFNKSYGNKK
jgi:hypothetical protein